MYQEQQVCSTRLATGVKNAPEFERAEDNDDEEGDGDEPEFIDDEADDDDEDERDGDFEVPAKGFSRKKIPERAPKPQRKAEKKQAVRQHVRKKGAGAAVNAVAGGNMHVVNLFENSSQVRLAQNSHALIYVGLSK